jgi:hypothetical protein
MGMMNCALPLAAAWAVGGLCGPVHAEVNVTTYHNDISRTGANTEETILTPANVNSTTFGRLFTVPVDGHVFAQPLYLSAVSIAGGTHDVAYVATEHDSVYAIDGDSGKIYAQTSLIPTGGTTVSSTGDLGCGDIIPEVGITGTPVIDAASGTLYVVAKSKVNGVVVQYLHALSVDTLTEKFGGPVQIAASVPGSDSYGSDGKIQFNAQAQNQRAALLLENSHVVIAWGSHCDHDPWHGWIMSYNAGTLSQEAAFVTSPNNKHSGIWMSGGGPAADASGNVYFATGNGVWDGESDFGDSVVKLGAPTNQALPVLDYFTPYNATFLNSNDVDVSASGLVLLPALPSGEQLLAQDSKQGTIYLLNTANLGKYCVNLAPACTTGDPQIVQEVFDATGGLWGSPAYWNGNLYWAGKDDYIRAFSFDAGGSGRLSTSPASLTSQIFYFSAPTPSVSANGNSDGIVWAFDGSDDASGCDSTSCLGLFAFDATNLATLLYSSEQAPNSRDAPGPTVKFETPVIANGKVYLGTQGALDVYGLLNGSPPPPPPLTAATPTFTPVPGNYSAAQSVTLSDGTTGAAIYYTSNGTAPTAGSSRYTAPISVNASETIEAIAVAPGYSTSSVATGSYTVSTASGGGTSVNLAAVDNVYGVVANGTPVTGGGWDNSGNAYSSNLLGTSVSYNGSTFKVGATGGDAVSGTTIALPAGNYGSLEILGSGVHGNQLNQPFIVTYTDGSTTTFTQSLSDWWYPKQVFPGETRVQELAYEVTATGSIHYGTLYLYGYTFALNGAKTVKNLTLPNNRDVVILAVDVVGAATAPVVAPGVNDPNGFASAAGLSLVGATVTDSALQLTTAGGHEGHAAWTAVPLNVQAFTTDFSFQITAGTNTADGMTFAIQNDAVSAVGASGAGLGYAGIASSVAVKFDLYSNAGEGPDSAGFYTDGAAPTVPATDMTSSGVNLHSGDMMHAHLVYDGTTLKLTLTDTVTSKSFSASQVIDIPATVGANTAYVGFTGGTGGEVSVQQITNWTYVVN